MWTEIMIQQRIAILSTLWLAVSVFTHSPASAQDTVILRSGNPVIGDVESLRRGSLSFDTPEMDVVEIDWDDIAFLTSRDLYEITLVSGAQYYGSLASADTGVLVMVGGTQSDTVPLAEVVRIELIERGFWARTNGFIDVGSNITRANSLKSLLISSRFDYRGPSGVSISAVRRMGRGKSR
jgi:hypothetical protein